MCLCYNSCLPQINRYKWWRFDAVSKLEILGIGNMTTVSSHNRTFSAKPSDITHEWFIVDATDKVLGRLAAKIAHTLRGKHKAIYTPHMDTGDFVVVTNVDKLVVTGKKTLQKIYYRHTGYPGGIYSRSFNEMLNKNPEKILFNAVKGMLPKGPLGYAMIKKLKVYADDSHPHSAQQPQQLVVE